MANNFIVDPTSVSQSQIYQDLLDYVQGLPDYQRWKDFYASSSGTTLLQLISGLGAFISYNVIVARREGFLPYVQNYSSAVAQSETVGYSVYRGRNPIILINVTPNFTGMQEAFTVIGAVGAQSLVLLQDTTFNTGVPIDVEAVVGNVIEESLVIQSANPSQFRFQTGQVSSDYQLLLNDVLVDTSERMIDMINGYFSVISNVLGSVDVNYLNLPSFLVQYITNDILKLRYILLTNTIFSETDVKYDFGLINEFSLVSLFSDPETIQSIKVNAPLFNETQFVIRGRDDYSKVFQLLNNTIVDTDYIDISPAIVNLCYVTENLCLFSEIEIANFISKLSSPTVIPMGLAPPTISHPLINFFDMLVTINVDGVGSPLTDVPVILGKYEKVLKGVINFSQIEEDIEELSYVQIARIKYSTTPWNANTLYNLGKYVTPTVPNGFIYLASSIVYLSGNVEPVWPNVIGQTVVDGRILWTTITCPSGNCAPGCVPGLPPIWQANTSYKTGDIVFANSRCYKASQLNLSTSSVPAVAASGTYSGEVYTAVTAGVAGNNITLQFNGIDDNTVILGLWNSSNPTNTASITSGNPTDVSPPGTLQLSGGSNLITNEPNWPFNVTPYC